MGSLLVKCILELLPILFGKITSISKCFYFWRDGICKKRTLDISLLLLDAEDLSSVWCKTVRVANFNWPGNFQFFPGKENFLNVKSTMEDFAIELQWKLLEKKLNLESTLLVFLVARWFFGLVPGCLLFFMNESSSFG